MSGLKELGNFKVIKVALNTFPTAVSGEASTALVQVDTLPYSEVGLLLFTDLSGLTDGVHTPALTESDEDASGHTAVADTDLDRTEASAALSSTQDSNLIIYRGTKRYLDGTIESDDDTSTGGNIFALWVGIPSIKPATQTADIS